MSDMDDFSVLNLHESRCRICKSVFELHWFLLWCHLLWDFHQMSIRHQRTSFIHQTCSEQMSQICFCSINLYHLSLTKNCKSLLLCHNSYLLVSFVTFPAFSVRPLPVSPSHHHQFYVPKDSYWDQWSGRILYVSLHYSKFHMLASNHQYIVQIKDHNASCKASKLVQSDQSLLFGRHLKPHTRLLCEHSWIYGGIVSDFIQEDWLISLLALGAVVAQINNRL